MYINEAMNLCVKQINTILVHNIESLHQRQEVKYECLLILIVNVVLAKQFNLSRWKWHKQEQ